MSVAGINPKLKLRKTISHTVVTHLLVSRPRVRSAKPKDGSRLCGSQSRGTARYPRRAGRYPLGGLNEIRDQTITSTFSMNITSTTPDRRSSHSGMHILLPSTERILLAAGSRSIK